MQKKAVSSIPVKGPSAAMKSPSAVVKGPAIAVKVAPKSSSNIPMAKKEPIRKASLPMQPELKIAPKQLVVAKPIAAKPVVAIPAIISNIKPIPKMPVPIKNILTLPALQEESPINPLMKQQQLGAIAGMKPYDLEKGLILELKTLHNHLQFSSADQVIPVMVSVKTLDSTDEDLNKLEYVKTLDTRPSVDLVCVIDNSSSMLGAKIENVKTTLLQLLDMLNENDRISLVLFNSTASLLSNLRTITKENKQELQRIVNSIYATGGTDINSGMEIAFEVLGKRKESNPVSSVFLLSDGQDGAADQRIRQSLLTGRGKILSQKSECFTIHTFGFGSDHDGPLMNRISEIKDGNFYYVEKINQIDEFFVDALGGLFSVIAQDIQIDIRLSLDDPSFKKFFSNARITKTYGDMWNVVKQGEVYNIKISQLISGVSKEFMMEVTIPGNSSVQKLEDFERNLELMKVSLTAIPIQIQYATKIAKEKNLILTLFTANEQIAADSEINDVVEFNYLRVKAAQAMDEAIGFSEKQQYDQGQAVLSEMLVKIQKSHPNNKSKLAVISKDLVDCQESAKPRVYENEGKYKMLNKKVANYKQVSQAVNEDDIYQNKIQKSMVSMQKMKKPHY